MARKIRRFWTPGVWNVFENGSFIGQVYKTHQEWTFNGSIGAYADIQTAVQMM